MSLMIAYASGECLSTIGRENVAADKSCMVFVMEPVIHVELVGRIRPVYNNLPPFSLLDLVILFNIFYFTWCFFEVVVFS